MSADANSPIPTKPGIILIILFAGLAIFFSPFVLEMVVSLNWKVGDVRPYAYGLAAIFCLLAIVSWLTRRRINKKYAQTFPDWKQLVFAVIGISLSISITLFALEGILRLLDLPLGSSWTPAEYRRAQFDPEIGWIYTPNQSVEQQFVVNQPKIPVYTNDLGIRVEKPGTKYDPDKPTLLMVGGSFTMGYGLPYEETMAGQLASIPGMPYQIVNLGVEAYGTDQSLLMLKRHFDEFNTRVVVYTFISSHINRNHNYDRRLLFRGARFIGTKPLFDLRRDGTPYLKKPAQTYGDYSYSRLWAVVELLWTRWGPKPDMALTKALIQEMQTYVESKGATFIVVNWDWASEGHRFRPAFFDEIHFNLIDTGENPPAAWSSWRIPGDSHPNAQATRHVAQLILAELQRLGLTTKQ